MADQYFKVNYCKFMLTDLKNSKLFCSEELKNLFRYPFAEKVGAEVLFMFYRKTFLTLLYL